MPCICLGECGFDPAWLPPGCVALTEFPEVAEGSSSGGCEVEGQSLGGPWRRGAWWKAGVLFQEKTSVRYQDLLFALRPVALVAFMTLPAQGGEDILRPG